MALVGRNRVHFDEPFLILRVGAVMAAASNDIDEHQSKMPGNCCGVRAGKRAFRFGLSQVKNAGSRLGYA